MAAAAAAGPRAPAAPPATTALGGAVPTQPQAHLLEGLDTAAAVQVLNDLTAHPRHQFWPDSLGYGGVQMRGVFGHRQVTDAYLAALARHRRAKLTTMDKGLAALHGDVAVMLAAD